MPSHAKAVGVVARLLRRLRLSPWRTAHELRRVAPMDLGTLRSYLRRMRDEGLIRARARVVGHDAEGEMRRGPKPLEYRVASEWGGCTAPGAL